MQFHLQYYFTKTIIELFQNSVNNIHLWKIKQSTDNFLSILRHAVIVNSELTFPTIDLQANIAPSVSSNITKSS